MIRARLHSSLQARFQRTLLLMLVPIALVAVGTLAALQVSVASFEDVAAEQSEEVGPLTRLAVRIRDSEQAGYDAYQLDRLSAFERPAKNIALALATSAGHADPGPERRALAAAAASWATARSQLRALVAAGTAASDPQADAMVAVSDSISRAAHEVEQAQGYALAETDAALDQARWVRRILELAVLALALLGLIIAASLGRRLSRSVVVPVLRLEEGARRIGDGELAHRVEQGGDDELGQLARSFNGMAAGLERSQAELATSHERLLASKKMEAVGQLAGGIAHDFNNLLLVVGTYADFLHESFEEDDPRRNDAAEIRQASDRAAALTRQLLTFSRRDLIQPVPLDLAATIAGLEQLLRRTLDASIDLRLELDHELEPTVIDAGQLEQVVLNLVLNGQNAMPDGGTLTVCVRAAYSEETLLADGLVLGPSVAIAVTDTGTGMTDAVRSQALEPFFTTRGDEGGSGLGLPTVHGIVTRAGGGMTIVSKLGEGTTVVLYLPTTTFGVPRPSSDEPVDLGEPAHGTVVLVAEDEPTIRELTNRILSGQGYTILTAASGAEALALARETERVDVLLTDVIMPGMTGNELAARLAEERPGLPIVYMSGYSDQMVAERGVLAADALYLRKPFKPQELIELMAEALAVPA